MKCFAIALSFYQIVRYSVLVAVVLSLGGFCWGQTATLPEGSGTSADPYQIGSLENLYWIAVNSDKWDKQYEQTTDIDASYTGTWDNGGWIPIGNNSTKFTGSYDGNGYKITGLYIDRQNSYYQGLFGWIFKGKISNLQVLDAHITGKKYVGIITGRLSSLSPIASLIEFCVSSGDLHGESFIGGIAGHNQTNGNIRNSYSNANVNGIDYVGGLVGQNTSTVRRCYSTGLVVGEGNNVGGLIGSDTGSVDESYWDVDTSNISSSAGGAGVVGKTTEELTYPYGDDVFTDWNFRVIWGNDIFRTVNNGYPILYYQIKTFVGYLDLPDLPNDIYEGTVGSINVQFLPSSEESEHINFEVTFSKDNSIDAIRNYFTKPENLAAYLRFDVDNGSVYRNGEELRFSLQQKPNQLWYRGGSGDWTVMVEGHSEDYPEAWYWDVINNQIVVTNLNINTTRGGEVFEYAADRGIDGETLPVELSSFTATATDQMYIQIEWRAETETNMLGYNIYRSVTDNIADAEKINFSIITAFNTSMAKDYLYIDNQAEKGKRYYYWLEAKDLDLSNEFYGPVSVYLEENSEPGTIIQPETTTEFRSAFPNPFNSGTNFNFSLAEPAPVSIRIYNSKGQFMRTLVERKHFDKGRGHILHWDGKDSLGRKLGSGFYYAKIETDLGFEAVKKLLLLK